MKKNILDFTFGVIGVILGILILAIGIYVSFSSWLVGLTIIIVGAFLAFSHNACFIDFKNKRVKFAALLFGLIKIGYWTNVKEDMYIKIIGSGNESKNENNEKIFEKYKTSLFSSENNEILVLLKSKRIENIKNFSNHFSEEFNIPIK